MNIKQIAGEYAAKYITDNMIIGLGTGTTIRHTILEIGKRINQGLSIQAVATSILTEKLASEQNIPLLNINDVPEIDVTIDGADEVNLQLDGIKGGGGALLREKMVALSSKENIWVIGENKIVNELGSFPLPVEVVPFASEHTAREIEKIGVKVTLRKNEEKKPFITDNHNYIFDLTFDDKIKDPQKLSQQLKQITGVVETGLFLAITRKVVIGLENGTVKIKTR